MEKSHFWRFCWLGLGNPCHIATKTPLEKLHQNLGLADPHPPQLGQKTKFFDRSHLRAPLSQSHASCFTVFLVCFLCVCDVIEYMGHFQGPAWLCPFIRYGLRPTGGEFIFHIISRRNKFTLYQEFNSRFNLQVNGHSFSAFANTISFNVSRYPTLSEVPCRSQILLGFQ